MENPNTPIERPELPPLRTFVVRRYHPLNALEIQEITVFAHEVTPGESLQFGTWAYPTPDAELPSIYIRRAFHSWIDYEEIVIPAGVNQQAH
jgi:hypothetical protein